jgi:hypothetical protein
VWSEQDSEARGFDFIGLWLMATMMTQKRGGEGLRAAGKNARFIEGIEKPPRSQKRSNHRIKWSGNILFMMIFERADGGIER